MKLKILILSFLAIFLVAGSAMATPVVDDGIFNLGEWSGYYAEGDGTVGPGGGGQAYDVEYLGLYITQDTVYFGLQTGFDVVGGRDLDGLHFGPGDFGLDINGDAVYDYAIDYSIAGSKVTYTLVDMSNIDADTYWDLVKYPQHSIADPYQAIYTSGDEVVPSPIGAFDSGEFGNVDGGISYVLEGSFDLDLLTAYAGGDMTIHWTMECGNDYLNQTSTPVPEPATMLLLGTGLVCFAGFGRKRFFKRG